MRNRQRLSQCVVRFSAKCLVLAAILTLSSSRLLADDPAVVRLSYVQDAVSVKQADASQVDHAVANMPLFAGSAINTGPGGEAEIEFPDGSVARLTPNSSITLSHLQRLGGSGNTDLKLTGGLAYFELNVGQGQRFVVRIGSAVLHPMENSIFRISLDKSPESAVFRGSLHADAVGGGSDFNEEILANQSARFDTKDPASTVIADEVTPDSWDQWNADRDAAIALQAQSGTPVRDSSQAPNDPGWNDLDASGNWYPVEGYGDVWTPGGVEADWDPFGYGYWGNFNGYGATWISGYSWGWLPYHCGAWNYFPFGWGWIPGGCGGGWSPLVTVWSTPPNYRLPALPKGGFIVPRQHRPSVAGGLIAVDRRPASGVHNRPGTTGGAGLANRGMRASAGSSELPASNHEKGIELNGKTILPIPSTYGQAVPDMTGNAVDGLSHVGVPVSRSTLLNRGLPPANHFPAGPVRGNNPLGGGSNVTAPIRPTYAPSSPPRPAPSLPARSAPAPAPHVSAPPPPAIRPH